MVASRINYSNTHSQAWENIYDIVKTKSYVADPTTSSAEYRKWVYNRFPDVKSSDFKGYPFIVVNGAEMEIPDNSERRGNSLDNVSKRVFWTLDIDVYASDRQYNNKGQDGKGMEYINAISDDLIQTFNNLTVRQTLQDNNIFFAKLNSTSSDVNDLSNEKVYVKSFTCSFQTKMNVTA
jgi:hypothetical protein